MAYRATLIDTGPSATFAETPDADELLRRNPFAFLLGVIFDEGIPAERAWQTPYELLQRVGPLDPHRLLHMITEVQVEIAKPRMLHRYNEIMADAVVRVAAKGLRPVRR